MSDVFGAGSGGSGSGGGLNYLGNWDIGTQYDDGDGVTYGGVLWAIATGSGPSTIGQAPWQEPAVWTLAVDKGQQGDDGADGADLLGTWMPFMESRFNGSNPLAGSVYVGQHTAATNTTNITTNAIYTTHSQWIDPADYVVSGKTHEWRVVASMATNNTALNADFDGYAALRPYNTAASGTSHGLGTIIAGSVTAHFTNPGAQAKIVKVSSAFSISAADEYCLGFVVVTHTTTGSSGFRAPMRLEHRYV